MKQYRKLLLEKCLGSLQGQVSSSATAEGMEALTKVLAELREGDIGSSFEAISKQCRAFFDNVSPDKSPPPHAISVCSVALRKYLRLHDLRSIAVYVAYSSGVWAFCCVV